MNAITIKAKVSSKDVQAKITEAFHGRPRSMPAESGWRPRTGTAVLSGYIRSREEAEAGERAAETAPGIVHVESHLEGLP